MSVVFISAWRSPVPSGGVCMVQERRIIRFAITRCGLWADPSCWHCWLQARRWTSVHAGVPHLSLLRVELVPWPCPACPPEDDPLLTLLRAFTARACVACHGSDRQNTIHRCVQLMWPGRFVFLTSQLSATRITRHDDPRSVVAATLRRPFYVHKHFHSTEFRVMLQYICSNIFCIKL